MTVEVMAERKAVESVEWMDGTKAGWMVTESVGLRVCQWARLRAGKRAGQKVVLMAATKVGCLVYSKVENLVRWTVAR